MDGSSADAGQDIEMVSHGGTGYVDSSAEDTPGDADDDTQASVVRCDTRGEGMHYLLQLLRAVVHHNSVCSLVPGQALVILGVGEDPGASLYDMWFHNHAARCQDQRVTSGIGSTEYRRLAQVTPILAAVLHSFPFYSQHI